MRKSVSDILKSAPDPANLLKDHGRYWAHIHPERDPEILNDHVLLVNQYMKKLVSIHGLDAIVDKLIDDLVAGWQNSDIAGEMVKQMFVYSVVFHDWGKVNPSFQATRMGNKLHFTADKNSPLDPPHGHSLLSAFLYISFHIDQIMKTNLSDPIKQNLLYCALQMGIPILKHHSSLLPDSSPTDPRGYKNIRSIFDALTTYLTQYNLHSDLQCLKQIIAKTEDIWKNTAPKINNHHPFPLFALVKLNFSLLTAADYMATHEYMNGEYSKAATNDFGVFGGEKLSKIFEHFRQYGPNNAIFESSPSYRFSFPQTRSKDNLNKLRQEMGIELLQTISKTTDGRLFYLEAPTGGGKTNLSLIACLSLLMANQELNKAFYVSPATTLITQTYKSVKNSLGLTENEIAPIHSKSGLHSRSSSQVEDEAYGKNYKDYIDRLFILYPFTLLSHVSFFDILKTNKKEGNYPLHRLCNAVVIIDEIQTYPPDIWDKLLFLISQYAKYFNMRFIIMSATLPKINSLNIGLQEFPEFINLLPNAEKYIKNLNFSGRVQFDIELLKRKISLQELATVVIEKSQQYIQQHGSSKTLIEFIFKGTAFEFFKEINKQDHPFSQIFILSGTILESRRREIINYIKRHYNKPENILLITTQVIEAGIDIDMDLGFKNISLPDFDEQFAARVNRNAIKEGCWIYLFNLDNSGRIYGNDYRHKQIQDKLGYDIYYEILRDKNFKLLYESVFAHINEGNNHNYSNHFPQYKQLIRNLHFSKADEAFKIIDQQNINVFVPLWLPVTIESETDGLPEDFFSADELIFLAKIGIYPNDNHINGAEIWEIYEKMVSKKAPDKRFDLEVHINLKTLHSIMSKFTFSLLYYSKDHKAILHGFGEDKFGYFYLSYWNEDRHEGKVYNYQHGLNSQSFSDANFL
ncbi:CRISPR-associated helicase Cas3' [Chitinophaga qingshengii]|uniref:CRISPR-associated helicase Cas3 n=1 Tax=Chitinophaga qingshengii TaxID=1569794 RepID=A0ABR7THA0_9BACT|nr:CRISPR-associated helicase Cas3' [Chitinophaga qingshengii]MBC9929881.1 CRISPR-associated helicase Cas3' [Chitinophaga qingshengii]